MKPNMAIIVNKTKTTTVPKYISDLLARSEWAVTAGRCPKACDPGYTILLHKRSPYGWADTLKKDAETLVSWATREMLRLAPDFNAEDTPVAVLYRCPEETHLCDQWAHVMIFDPIMKRIESLIPEKKGNSNLWLKLVSY